MRKRDGNIGRAGEQEKRRVEEGEEWRGGDIERGIGRGRERKRDEK